MSNKLLRQREWQKRHPERAALLREQIAIRKQYRLLEQGIIKTYEAIWDIIADYEARHKRLTGAEWWNIFEYLDWKYNNYAFTDLAFYPAYEIGEGSDWHDACSPACFKVSVTKICADLASWGDQAKVCEIPLAFAKKLVEQTS